MTDDTSRLRAISPSLVIVVLAMLLGAPNDGITDPSDLEVGSCLESCVVCGKPLTGWTRYTFLSGREP